jgi:hypothetical protein
MNKEEEIKILEEVLAKLPNLKNRFTFIELHYFWECYSGKLDAQFLCSSILNEEGCKQEFINCINEVLRAFDDCRIIEVEE